MCAILNEIEDSDALVQQEAERVVRGGEAGKPRNEDWQIHAVRKSVERCGASYEPVTSLMHTADGFARKR